jgi:CheY-like chemotaxis protein
MGGQRILIVDDNPINLKLAQVALRLDSYEVRTAGDAVEARQVIAEFTPNLILMDIQLPGTDGLELTREIKHTPEGQDICIVALTAYAMKGDEERMLAAGCDGYVAKPIDTRELAAEVARYLAAASARAGRDA